MCGIVGYIGDRDCADVLVNSLEKLEYRGYDSAGIAVLENGVIKVNGKAVDQDFIPESEQTATNTVNNVGNWSSLTELGDHMGWQREKTVKVPKGEYFVLGDHRTVSNDSRYWGFVNKDKVLGVVKVPFWGEATKRANINTQWKTYFEK